MQTKKETRGGTRANAGAKPKYKEKTITVSFRCPVSKTSELRNIVCLHLAKWSYEDAKSIKPYKPTNQP
jgi:hypothetical protein